MKDFEKEFDAMGRVITDAVKVAITAWIFVAVIIATALGVVSFYVITRLICWLLA